MEQGKSRLNVFLAFVLFSNVLLSLFTVGFVVYKTRTLEQTIFQLQAKLSDTLEADYRGEYDGDLLQRSRRSSKNIDGSKSCVSCHKACVTLFGLGSAAKVRL